MKKSILITGVAGLLGSRMADWIIENKPEYTVVGIDNLFGGYMENVNEKVVFYKRDISEDSLKDMLRFANAAAYLVTTKKGAIRAMPDPAAIQTILNQVP